MAGRVKRSEAELAYEHNENLQLKYKLKRFRSLFAMGVLFLGAILASYFGLVMTTFCLVSLGLIFLLRSLDANGQLQEVRRRSSKSLFPRFSLLKPKDKSEQSDSGQSLAHG